MAVIAAAAAVLPLLGRCCRGAAAAVPAEGSIPGGREWQKRCTVQGWMVVKGFCCHHTRLCSGHSMDWRGCVVDQIS